MKTVSLDEFKKQYGADLAAKFTPPTPPESGVGSRVSNTISTHSNDAADAFAGTGGQSAPRKGVEAVTHIVSAAPELALDVAPQPVRDAASAVGGAIGKGFKALTDIIGSNKDLQHWVIDHPHAAKALQEVAGTAGAAAEGTSDVLAAGGALKVPGAIASKTGEALGAIPKPGELLNTAATKIKDVRFALTNLDPQAETILKQSTLPEFEKYYETAAKAAVDPRAPSPLELAGTKAQDALKDVQGKLQTAGAQKQEFMGIGGGSSLPVDPKAITTFNQRLQSFINNKTSIEGDSKLIRDITAEFKQLGSTPSAGQVDRFVDYAQSRIYTGKRDLTVPVTDETAGALRSIVGQLNSSLKTKLGSRYTKLNSEYSRLIDLRNELNDKLGKDGEKGGALMKRIFSPSDANTKKLFADIQKETGIDLVKEATLARFVMESVGDTRQKSLLKQLDVATKDASSLDLTKPGSWLQFLRDKADLNAPEAARETIKRASPSGKQP